MLRIDHSEHYRICTKKVYEEGNGEVEKRYRFNFFHKTKTIILDHYLYGGKMEGYNLFHVLTKNEIEALIQDIKNNSKDYVLIEEFRDLKYFAELEKALEDCI